MELSKNCKIMIDEVGEEIYSTVFRTMEREEYKDSQIRIMPDVSGGQSITGFTATIGDCIDPGAVGSDAGCGVDGIFLESSIPPDKYALFEHRIRKEIPTGFDLRKERCFEMRDFYTFLGAEMQRIYQSSQGKINFIKWSKDKDIEKWLGGYGFELGKFFRSLGTLGSGNHFIEYDEGSGKYAVFIHSGSRGLGQSFFKRWRNKGILRGEEMKEYLTALAIVQVYASYNRHLMLEDIKKILVKMKIGGKIIGEIKTVHNYLDYSDMILRKGAVRAGEGDRFVIPLNMADGILLCEGLGNKDWNFSAPHGSGRKMSRSKAKETLDVDEYKEKMNGIYTTGIGKGTIDESPMAYKDSEMIVEAISPTCKITERLWPKINIKAGGGNEDDD